MRQQGLFKSVEGMHKSQSGKGGEAHWTAHGLNYWMALPRKKVPCKALGRMAGATRGAWALLQQGFKQVLGTIPRV